MKYINPIYLALIRNGYRNLAIEWFSENADFYHPIAVAQLKKMLMQQLSTTEERLLHKNEMLIKMGAVTY